MSLEMTLEEKNAILSDMVNTFQRQFDAIDEALGLATGPDDESSLQRTMEAMIAIQRRQSAMLDALEKSLCTLAIYARTDKVAKRAVAEIHKTLASAKCYGQPEKQAKIETTVPAIVFYPAGSLGEAIEEEGRPA